MTDPTELDLLRRLVSAMNLLNDVAEHYPLPDESSNSEDARVARAAHELAQEEEGEARHDFIHRMRIEKRPLSAWKDASSLAMDFLETRAQAQDALDSLAETEKRALRAPYKGDILFSKRQPF